MVNQRGKKQKSGKYPDTRVVDNELRNGTGMNLYKVRKGVEVSLDNISSILLVKKKLGSTEPDSYWLTMKTGQRFVISIEEKEKLEDSSDMYPIFDILQELLEDGCRIAKQDGEWNIFDSKGEGLISGKTFRECCVNLLMCEKF